MNALSMTIPPSVLSDVYVLIGDPGLCEKFNAIVLGCMNIHARRSRMPNSSNAAFLTSFLSNGECFEKALCSAASTFGGKHGPIDDVIDAIELGEYFHVPVMGFGSNVVKGVDDEVEVRISELLYEFATVHDTVYWNPEILKRIEDVKEYLENAKHLLSSKNVHPNLAFLTASICYIFKIPSYVGYAMTIVPRISGWLEDGVLHLKNKTKPAT